MYLQLLLVTILLLDAVVSAPLHDPSLNNGQLDAAPTAPEKRNPLDVSVGAKESLTTSEEETKQPGDLVVQETFYPMGGVWWGLRPWGGWGGYRPWYGWHGWHRPHWGGPSWGGHWGGPWGGSGWGRTKS